MVLCLGILFALKLKYLHSLAPIKVNSINLLVWNRFYKVGSSVSPSLFAQYNTLRLCAS